MPLDFITSVAHFLADIFLAKRSAGKDVTADVSVAERSLPAGPNKQNKDAVSWCVTSLRLCF
jgi:hypothetical protein